MQVDSKRKPRKTTTITRVLEAYLYCAGTQHVNLHQLSEAMSRVTYFLLRVHTGTRVSHSQHRLKPGRDFENNVSEWTGRVEISKEEIPNRRRSIHGYILTYSRL